MPPATYLRLTTPMLALPHASTPCPSSRVNAPSGSLLKDILVLQLHLPVEITFWTEDCRCRGEMRGMGRRADAARVRTAPCRAPHCAASSLRELKGDCGIERRRGKKKFKNHEIGKQLGLKPWQRCNGCLPVMCCGKKGRLPLPPFPKPSLRGEGAQSLCPRGGWVPAVCREPRWGYEISMDEAGEESSVCPGKTPCGCWGV